MTSISNLGIVGVALPRVDAAEKTSGRALYTADLVMPGALSAKVLRSARPHARIARLDASRARQAPGVHAVLTAHELGAFADARYGYFIKDRPIVAIDKVLYQGDIMAAVAAESEEAAVRALALIEVELVDIPVLGTIEEALAPDAPELFDAAPSAFMPHYGVGASAVLRPRRNVCFQFDYRSGAEDAFARCDLVFEDEFRFSRMHHFALEPFVSVARASRNRIEVWTASHTPFVLRRELARIFGLPENAVTVHVPYVGGSYGSKGSCRTEPIAILLSMMSGRPVRLAFSQEEGFFTNSQHGAILRLKSGVMRDGTLIARASDILLDSGAYSDASPLVAEKAGYRVPGPYRWAFIDTKCSCVMTNTVPAGAFRGFGGTQATWACESQIDMIARRLGIDPLALRRKNLLRVGEPFVPGETAVDSDLAEGLEVVAREVGYRDRVRHPNRGIGLAVGFKDSGGVNKPAQARVKVTGNGDLFLHCGTIEIGQGAMTALSQVVAEIMGAPLARVRYAAIDTDHVPFDQGTTASSGMTVMGQAVARAADFVRRQVLEFAAAQVGCPAAELSLENWVVLRGAKEYPLGPMIARFFGGAGFEFSGDGFFKVEQTESAPFEAPCVFWEVGWTGVEVEVDRATGLVTVLKLVASSDAGRAINPLICRGQDEGAAVMGMGQSLFERMIYRDGRLLNGEALAYRLPLAKDLPAEFVSITQEHGLGPGPFGAKGIGEGAILSVASAIANAIEDAVGVRVVELPMTPERVLAALECKNDAV